MFQWKAKNVYNTLYASKIWLLYAKTSFMLFKTAERLNFGKIDWLLRLIKRARFSTWVDILSVRNFFLASTQRTSEAGYWGALSLFVVTLYLTPFHILKPDHFRYVAFADMHYYPSFFSSSKLQSYNYQQELEKLGSKWSWLHPPHLCTYISFSLRGQYCWKKPFWWIDIFSHR